jgi:hypothetical protein
MRNVLIGLGMTIFSATAGATEAPPDPADPEWEMLGAAVALPQGPDRLTSAAEKAAKESLTEEDHFALDLKHRTWYRASWGLIGGGFVVRVLGVAAEDDGLFLVGSLMTTFGDVGVASYSDMSAKDLNAAGLSVNRTAGQVALGLMWGSIGLGTLALFSETDEGFDTLSAASSYLTLGSVAAAIVQANTNRNARVIHAAKGDGAALYLVPVGTRDQRGIALAGQF